MAVTAMTSQTDWEETGVHSGSLPPGDSIQMAQRTREFGERLPGWTRYSVL